MFCSPEGKKTKINKFENTSKNTNNHQNNGFEIFSDVDKNLKNSKPQNKEKEFEIFSDIKCDQEKNRKEINLGRNSYNENKTINLDSSTNNDNNIRKNSFDSVLSDNFQFGGEHTNTLGFSTSELSVIREVRYAWMKCYWDPSFFLRLISFFFYLYFIS